MRKSFPLEDVINGGPVTKELERKSLGEYIYIIHTVKEALWVSKETLAPIYQNKASSDPYIELFLKFANESLEEFTVGFEIAIRLLTPR